MSGRAAAWDRPATAMTRDMETSAATGVWLA
jgi:hypothetical protein